MANNISEESLNTFLRGMQLETVQPIKMYGPDRIQIWGEDGWFLSISSDSALSIDLLGPDPPEQEQLKEMWDDANEQTTCNGCVHNIDQHCAATEEDFCPIEKLNDNEIH